MSPDPTFPVVRAALGKWVDGFLPMLQFVVPEERFVAWPSDELADALVVLPDDWDEVPAAITDEVQWVHVLAAGVDKFPLDLVGDRLLTCSRGASAPAIAEFVLASMLAFEKQLPDVWLTEPPAHWNLAGLGGLRGKTLGLVGVGAIGTEVARRALAFDMDVVGLRRTDGAMPLEGMARAPSLHELLARSDHVVVAAPATAATHQLIDAAAFEAIKEDAHLVNVARGSLIDQDALRAALDRGKVARASLDVVDPEPLPAGHWLYTHPRVRLSPHVSWSSPGTIDRTIELFADNLRRWREGRPLHGQVDVLAGY
jgi:phosphoglycerate dehydrogenase-like enzyme